MVAKVPINARIPEELKAAVETAANKRGITTTTFIIQALTHELHSSDDSRARQELLDIKNYIDSKLESYPAEEEQQEQEEFKDLDYYVEYVREKQEQHNYITESLWKTAAKGAGLTPLEFNKILDERGIKIVIT